MRLPPNLLDSPYFVFLSEDEVIAALRGSLDENGEEEAEINRLASIRLPPITSIESLSVMIGINPGFVWSMIKRPGKHYSSFEIPKGRTVRQIVAPKVGLKIIQTWIARHLQNVVDFPPHVFGFVPGRSHIDAAAKHCPARWVHSFDIENFFPTTPSDKVVTALKSLGYSEISTELITPLLCYQGFLAQGAPSSPVISNLVFSQLDRELEQIAYDYKIILTRYADDIVFSGKDKPPKDLEKRVRKLFDGTCWSLANDKIEFFEQPQRLKVHGLLVDGAKPRLTKGYRNKIRAYKHILNTKRISDEDKNRLVGHLQYSSHVEKR
ncbi:MAG: reverse transcriptase family protein [Pseudomonadota bacterium]